MTSSIQAQEFVYKNVDGLDISLDVYLPTEATAEKPAAVFVWFHGGGLFQGTRKACPPNLLSMPSKKNIALISIDYRLAPQTPLPLILQDCLDSITFIRTLLPSKLSNKIDPSRLGISGGSAGGWLALLLGIPGSFGAVDEGLVKCVVPIYPITDVETGFYTTKQRPVSYWPKGIIPEEAAAPHIDPTSGPIVSSSTTSPRSIVYHYTLQEALWSQLWFANASQIPSSYPSTPAEFSITPRLENATKQGLTLPPMFVTSGTKDDKVDPEGARKLVKRLKEMGAEVTFDEREGLDHLFDQKEEEEMSAMHEWLEKKLL